MFRFLCKKAIQNIYRIKDSTTKHACFLKPQSLKSYSNISNSANQQSFTVNYLINSCGLSLDSAISASTKINITTTEKPDSVLQLFKTYGFTETQITNLITTVPSLLLAKPDTTLKPKFEFFQSLGMSKPDIATMLSSEKRILHCSLRNRIIPNLDFLKGFLHTNENIINAIKRCTRFVHCNIHKAMVPNISTLRVHGVPDSSISKLLIQRPRAFNMGNNWFEDVVKQVKKMGLNPKCQSTQSFVLAFGIMVTTKKSIWEQKIEAYKSFGWSNEDAISAFKLQPNCMRVSEKKIRILMDFYLNKLGLKPSDVAKCPNLMLISLEQRIIPRCSVLQVLLSNGLIQRDLQLTTALIISKKGFEQKFVIKYQDITPEVVEAYEGELGYPKFEELRLTP